MAAVGFGPGAQRCVHLGVAVNGWHTEAFLVDSCVFQSPLLFVLAAQPVAAHARLLAQQQAFQPITLRSKEPAQTLLDSSVGLHCAATCARLLWTGLDPVMGVTFAASCDSLKHLGSTLSNQPPAAATAHHTAIVTKVVARIARWWASASACWAGRTLPSNCCLHISAKKAYTSGVA